MCEEFEVIVKKLSYFITTSQLFNNWEVVGKQPQSNFEIVVAYVKKLAQLW